MFDFGFIKMYRIMFSIYEHEAKIFTLPLPKMPCIINFNLRNYNLKKIDKKYKYLSKSDCETLKKLLFLNIIYFKILNDYNKFHCMFVDLHTPIISVIILFRFYFGIKFNVFVVLSEYEK
jgi:hypothetical protein